MDFFENQERARRASARLVLLYALAVLGIVAGVEALLHVAWLWNAPPGAQVPVALYVFGAMATLGLMLSVTAVQVARLAAGGGDAVARMAGARRVAADTRDPNERRLLNVVEEMAIAAGVRVPNVYVMDREEGLNAFAAGYDASHAVLAVTRGTLVTLNRDELQGVVGHELSHVLNGDVRLDIRMLGVLAGIVFLGALGRFLMHGAARSRNRNAGALVFVGVGLFAIGAVGLVAAQLIKAAVSRQREFLADASSVQFTRNPEAIAGALDQIGLAAQGTRVANRYAEDMSHMYFADAAPALFATHPPLAERIRRVHPKFDAADYRRRRAAPRQEVKAEEVLAQPSPQMALALIGALAPERIGLARRLLSLLPADLHGRIETPEGARAFLLSLMAPECALPRALRLPAVDLALVALKGLAPEAKRALLGELQAAIEADRRVSLHELIVLVLVRDQLSGAPGAPAGRRTLAELRAAADVLVALLSPARPAADEVTRALQALKALAPLEKEKLLKELLAAAFAGGGLEIVEAELVRLVAAVLDCPIPPLVEA